jgi:serine/threonine protein kinase
LGPPELAKLRRFGASLTFCWIASSGVSTVDFGLARGSEPDAQFTQAGTVIGTPAYMAPEQGSGTVVDAPV